MQAGLVLGNELIVQSLQLAFRKSHALGSEPTSCLELIG